MAVGEDAFSAGPTGRSVNDFGDGTSNTIAIAEMSESGIHWMEPRDLDVDKMSFKVNDRKGQAIRSKHPGVVNALLADGSAHSISEDIDPHVLKALFTFAADDDAPVSDNLLR